MLIRRSVMRARLIAVATVATTVALLLWGSAVNAAPVMIPAAQASGPPRTDTGTGMCLNAIHLGSTMVDFFTVDAAGITTATGLLDTTFLQNMIMLPVTESIAKQRLQIINFRNFSPDSVGDFTPPSFQEYWFPFTQKGVPMGNDKNFAVRVRGYLNIPSGGAQTFALRGDDLARLIIGSTQVMLTIDARDGALTRQVVFGDKGLYPFEILQFQNSSQAILEMSRADGSLPEGPNVALDTATYRPWTSADLFSAVAGQGSCQECNMDPACGASNFCRDSLCQPCLVKDHCGVDCKACLPPTAICNAPDGNPVNAHCVECLTNVDCPSGMCDTNTGKCLVPDMRPLADLAPPPDLFTPGDKRPPQCTVDTDCPLGKFCEGGTCKSCLDALDAGLVAYPRAPGDTGKPICVKPGYRGSWACNATGGPGGSGAAPLGLFLFALFGMRLLFRGRRRQGVILSAAFFLLAGADHVHAQTATPLTLNLQTYQPAIGSNNILSVDGSRTPGKTTFFLNVLGDYALHPLRYVDLNSGQVLNDTVPHLLTIHVMPGVGIGPWFSLGVDLPVVAYQGFGQATPTFPNAPGTFGLGDLRVAAKVRLKNNDFEGFGAALLGQVTIPLPLDNTSNLHSAGKGNVGIEPRLVLDWHWRGGGEIALNLGFLAYLDQDLQGIPGMVKVADQVRYGLGGLLPVSEVASLFGELYGGYGIKQDAAGQTYAPLEAMVGLRLASHQSGVVANLGVGTGLISDPGAPQLRVVFGLGYLPSYSDPDIDKDGVLNKDDRCPTIPGPRDNQGCPWPDTDGDGLIDPEDACPTIPGPRENHGCPDKDTDKDGVVDRLDKCPTIPGPKENQGCPWPDTDGDGIIDPEDKCPTIPGPKENHGCPWPDTDGDGLIDPEDKCPLVPGPKENQGCPDVDTDGDGIVDRLDKCPLVPGVPPTGCPERKFILVTQDKIELKQKVFFATNKSKIMPASFDLLNEVVEVLKERPTMKLRIEGHTDSRGGIDLNTKLSKARADAVREYLVTAGTGPDRLTSEGFGPSRPIGDNKTPEGQDKNRRTEFYIVEQ